MTGTKKDQTLGLNPVLFALLPITQPALIVIKQSFAAGIIWYGCFRLACSPIEMAEITFGAAVIKPYLLYIRVMI